MDSQTHGLTTRGVATATILFYLLIAFEFFYMASPFAAYFYSAYRPGLGFLLEIPGGKWLVGFFLPHYVATHSSWINLLHPLGIVLMMAGLLGFVVGVGQVYFAKLTRGGVVSGGIYRWVRHPQYTALAISGLGLLLLWPRNLALLLLVSMLFVYYLLARLEERECLRKYGAAYADYLERTGRFQPFRWPRRSRPTPLRSRRSLLLRVGMATTAYLVAVVGSLAVAWGVKSLTIDSLCGIYTADSAYLAVTEIPEPQLRQVIALAGSSPEVAAELARVDGNGTARFINYVLPAGTYVSEVPMHQPAGRAGHAAPSRNQASRYLVIFTRAILRTDGEVSGREIVDYAVTREPLLEVHVDLSRGRVVDILSPPPARYRSVPVPIY